MASQAPGLPPGFVLDQAPASQPRPIPRVIQGPPREPTPQTPAQSEGEQLQNVIRRNTIENANVPQGYRRTQNGNLEAIPGGPADQTRLPPRNRQLPEAAINRLTEGTTTLSALRRARDGFHDDFAGNTLTGSMENWLQSRFNTGTPGQNQWWQDMLSTDNVARNAIFGASLTEGEKAAWERTTVNPSMSPQQVRANIERRMEIAQAALRRSARTYAANGYNSDAINEQLGDFQSLMHDTSAADQTTEAAAAGSVGGAASGSGDWDFATRFRGLPEGSPERFRMLQQYHDAVERGDLQGFVGDFSPTGAPQNMVDTMGVSQEERQQLLDEYQRALPIQQAREGREQFAQEHPILAGVDTFVRSGANALTLGWADRAAGGDPLLLNSNPEGVAQQHAITSSDWENRPLTSFGGTLAGGSLLPLGGTNALRQMAMGGVYGGAYGYMGSDGTQQNRVENALLGAAGGAGTVGLVNAGMRAAGFGGAPRGGPGGFSQNVEAVQAARRQNVDLMPADLGNPTTARLTGGMRQTIGGAGPVARAAQRTERQVGERLSGIAQNEGLPVKEEVLGDVTRTAMENYNAGSGEYGRQAYANARDLAHGTQLQGSRANAILQRDLEELQATSSTDAPLIAGLQRLQSDIAPQGSLARLTVDQMRRLRTTVRSEAQTDALRSTDYQHRAKEVLNALSDDITQQLPPAAARAFREADRAWAQRLDFIDDVENNILGPRNNRSAETVARRLLNMTRGDSARFKRVLDTVSAEESRMIRGSAIEDLGRASNGSPNAGGFSMDTFLTNYEALPERTRAILFRGQSRADVDDLAAIALARRTANRSGNFSGTGGAVNVSGAVHNASAITAWGSLGLSLIVENITGRLLASPRFMRAVAHPPREPGRALRTLRRVAVAEPALRPNIERIIQAIQRTGQDLGPAMPRAAADDRQQRQDRR